jgi:hypothetical protein
MTTTQRENTMTDRDDLTMDHLDEVADTLQSHNGHNIVVTRETGDNFGRVLFVCETCNEDLVVVASTTNTDPFTDPDTGEHRHVWGDMEHSHMAGTLHRKCTAFYCDVISLDFDDDDDEYDDGDEFLQPERFTITVSPLLADTGLIRQWLDQALSLGVTAMLENGESPVFETGDDDDYQVH